MCNFVPYRLGHAGVEGEVFKIPLKGQVACYVLRRLNQDNAPGAAVENLHVLIAPLRFPLILVLIESVLRKLGVVDLRFLVLTVVLSEVVFVEVGGPFRFGGTSCGL